MTTPTTVTPLATFRNQTPYPFCPGCGHGPILDQLNAALVALGRDPHQVVLVSDIGCSGLSDQYFDTNAFHGLHGRSLTYASGIKLANPDLDVVVVMGDGGTGIGGAHLLAAARRDLDLTVLVFDNFNFGMTGGQASPTTPAGGRTATTPAGNHERPLDLCATVAAAGAGYVDRATSFDDDLPQRIAEAIRHPGFALLDIWEPCTAHYAPRNRLSRKAIFELVESLGLTLGRQARPHPPSATAAESAAATPPASRAASPGTAPAAAPLAATVNLTKGEAPAAVHAATRTPGAVAARPIAPCCRAALAAPRRVVLAGSAGGRVGSAARLLARAALAADLQAAMRSDYPVTVQTGYSLAEVVLAAEPIEDLAIERPDALLLLTAEGLKQAARYLARMTAADTVFALPGLPSFATAATVIPLDPATAVDPTTGRRLPRDSAATVAAVALARRLDLLPEAALLAAAGEQPEVLAATRTGLALAG